ncbi:MAG: DHH family phosphoesterase, partial [Candidatus Micrarchaeota archaeon]
MKITGAVIKKDLLNTTRFYLCTGNEIVTLDSHEELPIDKLIEVTGEHTHYFFNVTSAREIADIVLEKKIKEFLSFNQPKVKLFTDAPSLCKMEKSFENAAEAIAQAVFQLRTIKIRYDGDCDGIMAALIMKKGIEQFASDKKIPLFIRFQQSSGAVYREKDREEDNGTLVENSLLILLDHGANEESKNTLCHSAKNFEVMAIDHHPPAQKHCIKHFVSPFTLKNCDEPASYNTGMLAFEISRRLAPEIEDALLPYRYYSMQSDTSSFRKKEFFQEPITIDY